MGEHIKMIRWETTPCWYELSWRDGIVLRIHKDFANSVAPISEEAPIIKGVSGAFGFTRFGGKLGEDFGFQNCLKFLGINGDFLEYSVPTPLCRKQRENCENCGGTGKDDDMSGGICFHCDGEGKESYYDYSEANAVSATLSVMFEFLRFADAETSSVLPQLICLNLAITNDGRGCFIGGEYSREAVGWMRKKGRNELPEVVESMKFVWERMAGIVRGLFQHDFYAYLGDSDGWLLIGCPGDACGLHPSHGAEDDVRRGRGYGFGDHNVDHPMQQLTLLSALSALHDLMRRP